MKHTLSPDEMADEYRELCYSAWLRREDICTIFGYSERSVRGWEYGERPVPRAVLMWLRLLATGDLGLVDETWSGWILKNGYLGPRDRRDYFTPGEINAMFYERQQLRALKTRLRRPIQWDLITGEASEPMDYAPEVPQSSGRIVDHVPPPANVHDHPTRQKGIEFNEPGEKNERLRLQR